MFTSKRWVAVPVLSLLHISGCASISSTPISRTDDDVVYGDSNGDPLYNCAARPFKGVPITLRVPTHLDVVVREVYYLVEERGELKEVPMSRPCVQVDAKLVETEKVFTVDPKRPASGTLGYTMQFGANGDLDNRQYFKQITSKIQDDTIKDVSTAISKVLPAIAKLTAGGTDPIPTELKAQMIEDYRTVAWKRFDLDAPDFEDQVRCFAEAHINCDPACRTLVAP